MYGLNPFVRPRSSYERPVPLIFVNPADNPDYSVCFRKEWLPYILGSLQQLLLQTTWKTDDPVLIAEQQQRAALLIALFAESCPMPVPDGVEFEGSELDMTLCESLRFQDGKLQAFCCGQWTDIPGQPDNGIGGTGQPGDGAPQAKPGGCVKYTAKFSANETWLLPTVVNTGDTLSFTGAKGAGTDGPFPEAWRCPNGQIFFAGICAGGPIFVVTDPNPLIEHMRLVAVIDGQYYAADQGVLTVPSVPANSQVGIQVNDGSLADNSGDYMLTIEHCNNQEGTWTHTLALDLASNGWTPVNDGGGDRAVYVLGSGFQANPAYKKARCTIQSPVFTTATHIDSVQVVESVALDGPTPECTIYLDSTGQTVTGPGPTFAVGAYASTGTLIQIDVINDTSNPSGTQVPGNLKTVIVSGHGFDPFA